jgi:hypothetical protein
MQLDHKSHPAPPVDEPPKKTSPVTLRPPAKPVAFNPTASDH